MKRTLSIQLGPRGVHRSPLCASLTSRTSRTSSRSRGISLYPGRNGLGLLPLRVRFELPKTTNRVSAHVTEDISVLPGPKGEVLNGYEIHTGRASVSGGAYPLLFEREGREPERDGAVSEIGTVFGTHLHGLFNNGAAVEALRRFLGREPAPDIYDERAETSLGELASIMRENLDMEFVRGLIGPSRAGAAPAAG